MNVSDKKQCHHSWRRDGYDEVLTCRYCGIAYTDVEYYKGRVEELSRRIDGSIAENLELRHEMRSLLDSAYPHPVEHPAMYEAWRHAEHVLDRRLDDYLSSFEDRTRKIVAAEVYENLADELKECILSELLASEYRKMAERLRRTAF